MEKLEIKLPIKKFELKEDSLIVKDADNITHCIRTKDGKHIFSIPVLKSVNIDDELSKQLVQYIEEKIESIREEVQDKIIRDHDTRIDAAVWEEFAVRLLNLIDYKGDYKIIDEAIKDWSEEGWVNKEDYNKP